MRPANWAGYFKECTDVQSVNSYNGKVLRVDPNTGNGIRTNPSAGRATRGIGTERCRDWIGSRQVDGYHTRAGRLGELLVQEWFASSII
jgi:hypothetical protein